MASILNPAHLTGTNICQNFNRNYIHHHIHTHLSREGCQQQISSRSRRCQRRPVKCTMMSILPAEMASQVQGQMLALAGDDMSVLPVVKVMSDLVAELPDSERWTLLWTITGGWIYLTARPGVLIGAIDAYIFAPVQLVVDTLLKRRSLKRTDFVVGERIGEGSFGVVYAGAMLPSNANTSTADNKVGRRAKRMEEYEGFQNFQKVILKKVKIGVEGAEECGNMEEWFNYRLSRAAPDVCANFLGSFISDTTRGQFTQGGRWLVWKFEVCSTLTMSF